jgi:hypothetical protein
MKRISGRKKNQRICERSRERVKKKREKMYSRSEGERERTCEGKGKFLKKFFLYEC